MRKKHYKQVKERKGSPQTMNCAIKSILTSFFMYVCVCACMSICICMYVCTTLVTLRIYVFFYRFFFLSNDEMLDVLSEIQKPSEIQKHLNKLFNGIIHLNFSDLLDITSMSSNCGEHINFQDCVSISDARGCVEKWLSQVYW